MLTPPRKPDRQRRRRLRCQAIARGLDEKASRGIAGLVGQCPGPLEMFNHLCAEFLDLLRSMHGYLLPKAVTSSRTSGNGAAE
jgi:hypothetical protein